MLEPGYKGLPVSHVATPARPPARTHAHTHTPITPTHTCARARARASAHTRWHNRAQEDGLLERVVVDVRVRHVTPLVCVSGRLVVTTTRLYLQVASCHVLGER